MRGPGADHLDRRRHAQNISHESSVHADQGDNSFGSERLYRVDLTRRTATTVANTDGQFGADDFRDRSADWGIRQVIEYKGARLYQLP